MTEYSAQIDQQIAQLLRTRQIVSPSMIPGVSEAEGVAFLQHYAQIHPESASFDGAALAVADSVVAPAEGGYQGADPPPDASIQAPPPVPGLGDQAAVGAQELPPGAQATYAGGPEGAYMSPDGAYATTAEGIPLDVAAELQRSEPAPNWPWILPIFWGIVGGIIAWAIVKEKDADKGRNMIILGGVVTALSLCLSFGLAQCAGGFATGAVTDTAWPATGRSTFYYFGSPT
jgi:hypothetical protein